MEKESEYECQLSFPFYPEQSNERKGKKWKRKKSEEKRERKIRKEEKERGKKDSVIHDPLPE